MIIKAAASVTRGIMALGPIRKLFHLFSDGSFIEVNVASRAATASFFGKTCGFAGNPYSGIIVSSIL